MQARRKKRFLKVVSNIFERKRTKSRSSSWMREWKPVVSSSSLSACGSSLLVVWYGGVLSNIIRKNKGKDCCFVACCASVKQCLDIGAGDDLSRGKRWGEESVMNRFLWPKVCVRGKERERERVSEWKELGLLYHCGLFFTKVLHMPTSNNLP